MRLKDKNLSLLIFSRYDEMGASSRYRIYQFIPFLKASGYRVVTYPLFTDEFVKAPSSAFIKKTMLLFWAYVRRLIQLRRALEYDVILVQKEMFPYLPALAERLLRNLGVKVVVDFDDAIFDQYRHSSNWFVKATLSNKIAVVMRASSAVIAGNRYLADYALSVRAPAVCIVPTTLDLARYEKSRGTLDKDAYTQSDKLILGWIGSQSTVSYVSDILPVFERAQHLIKQIFIVGGKFEYSGPLNIRFLPWSEDGEQEALKEFDAGFMPLPDTPWAKGKCGFKLIQYMASSLPTIASPIGMNIEIVDDNVNGFLADTDESWVSAIESLARLSSSEREAMGAAGRRKVEREFSNAMAQAQLLKILNHVVEEH